MHVHIQNQSKEVVHIGELKLIDNVSNEYLQAPMDLVVCTGETQFIYFVEPGKSEDQTLIFRVPPSMLATQPHLTWISEPHQGIINIFITREAMMIDPTLETLIFPPNPDLSQPSG